MSKKHMSAIGWEESVPPNPFQTNKSWLVVASAGCGKTHTIERVIEELLANGVDPSAIMYILFNKRPADEFRQRFLEKGVPEEKMRWWGTHHAIARRLLGIPVEKILRGKRLKKWGEAHGFDFSDEDEEEEIGASTKTAWDEILSSMDVKLYDGDPLDPQEQRLFDALLKSEQEEGFYTDTRYLLRAINMRLVPPGIQYVFVDEGQDNGKVQFDYFRFLVEREDVKGFMMCGDDKQAINRFKGGRSELFLDFVCERYVCLPKTYRCHGKVLEKMNQIIAPVKKRSPTTSLSHDPASGEVGYLDDFEDCLFDILDKAKKGESQFILSRNNHYLREAYKRMLRFGIPMKLKWLSRMRRTVEGLRDLKRGGMLTGDILEKILPNTKVLSGQLLKKPFFERGAVEKLRSGAYGDDWEAWELWGRIGGAGVPKEEMKKLGFTPYFMECLERFNFGVDAWSCKTGDLYYFKQVEIKAGLSWVPVELLSIHQSKGGEADNVWALTNITKKVEQAEFEEPDEERKVWYVATSRAKKYVCFTTLRGGQVLDLTTRLV